jgi:dTMP kinase
MLAALAAGRHLVIDRYAYSGIAFSATKPGMGGTGEKVDWTTSPDRGLLAPDVVIFLDVTPEIAQARGNFGEERYEKKEIQARVRTMFAELRAQAGGDASAAAAGATPFGVGVPWRVVNAGGTPEEVHAQILALANEAIAKAATTEVTYL